jgi:hypothetical protein
LVTEQGTATPVRARAQLLTVAVLVVSACAATGCGRTAEEQAAVRAQEACIAALGPVAEDKRPSPDALRSATRSAEAAARADGRWQPLQNRVIDFRATIAGDPDSEAGRESLDALAQECGRVNQIVKERREDV